MWTAFDLVVDGAGLVSAALSALRAMSKMDVPTIMRAMTAAVVGLLAAMASIRHFVS